MTAGRRPWPDIGPAAWTVLLRADSGRAITIEAAAQIVGPDLAAEAIDQLTRKHLVLEDGISPLGETFRRWHRQRGGSCPIRPNIPSGPPPRTGP